MAASDGDINERLSDLWTEWGLKLDSADGTAQHQAAKAVATWLEKGKKDPEIAIRAAQILLADPERPGVNKRPSWVMLRKVLTDAWPNAGTAPEHVSFAQALLLAAWPSDAQQGSLGLVSLFESARHATTGLGTRQETLERWWSGIQRRTADAAQPSTSAIPGVPQISVTPFAGVSFASTAALKQAQAEQAAPQWQSTGANVVQVLQDHQKGLAGLSDGLKTLSQQAGKLGQDLTGYVRDTIQNFVLNEVKRVRDEAKGRRAQLDLLWWGQARYCRALATPYRRLARKSAESVFWWAAYEAAELSQALDTEPAAAYLVETLHALGQDVFEKKPLIQWLEEAHAVLQSSGDKAPKISRRLAAITEGDALGLPVTWSRVKAARNEPFTGAAEAVALDLEAEIDRGEWASWIFREVLLDLHLADES